MRKTLLALAAFAAIGIATPVATSSEAEAQTKVIVKGGGHHHGMHRGHHHGRKVIVVKKRGHHHHHGRGHLRRHYH